MKVLFVGNDKSIITGDNGDSRERMRAYAKYFDHLFIIVFSLTKDSLTKIEESKLTIIPTNSKSRWFYIWDSLTIIRSLDFSLISAQDPFVAGLVGVLVRVLFQKKLNIQVHNIFFKTPYFKDESLFNKIFYWLGKFNLNFADSVRIVNPNQRVGAKSFFAPVSADLDFFWGKPHKKVFHQVVCVARLTKQKNLPLLFEVAKKFPRLEFVVIGEGEERLNLEKVKPDNVKLVGQKNREQIKDIYDHSDLFVLTSNYEGYAIVVLESLAAGLPVVMTDTGCAGTLILNDRVGGMVLPVGDTEGIAKAICLLLSNRRKAKVLVEKGQEELKKNYSQEILRKKFIDGLYNT